MPPKKGTKVQQPKAKPYNDFVFAPGGWADEPKPEPVAQQTPKVEARKNTDSKSDSDLSNDSVATKPSSHDSEEEKKTTFSQTPKRAQVVPKSKGKVIPMGKVKVVSNLFIMKFLNKLDVFVYPVDISPEPAENDLRVKVMRSIASQVNQVFYPFALAGKCIVSKAEIFEDQCFKAPLNDTDYEVTIRGSCSSFFSQKVNEESKNEQHLMIDNVLNYIIKHANREVKNMFQLGKRPQFYNMSLAQDIEEGYLRVVPGFKSCAFKYQQNSAMLIDNTNKFMSQQTCLSVIYEI